MEYFKLNNGEKMPAIGFGVYQIPKDETKNAVLNALKVGYRKIDTAQSYFNEKEVGDAIKESKIPREELFITTKIWIDNYGYDKAKKSVIDSMKKLQVDYIDLVLLHQPFSDYYGAYHALIDLQKEGKIKSIGVSNFYPDRLSDICAFGGEVPQVNQIEINPMFQQEKAVENMKKNNVLAESWGPFREGKDNIFNNEVLINIASKYNKTSAQVILRWLFQRGISSNCKSTKIDRMRENFDIFDFELTNDDMNEIKKIDLNKTLFINHETPEAVELFKEFVKQRKGKN